MCPLYLIYVKHVCNVNTIEMCLLDFFFFFVILAAFVGEAVVVESSRKSFCALVLRFVQF